MGYFFASIIIISSILFYFQQLDATYGSFEHWEEDPVRYLIENTEGAFFKEAMIKANTPIVTHVVCFRGTHMSILFNRDHQILFEGELVDKDNLSNTISDYLQEYKFIRRTIFDLKTTESSENFNIPFINLSIRYDTVVIRDKPSILKEVFYGIQEYKAALLKQVYKDPEQIPLKVIKELDSIVNTRVKIDNYTSLPPPPPPPFNFH